MAGIEFHYSIREGKRFINGLSAEEFMATLTTKQLKAILDEAVLKNNEKN